jgi:trehalose 6-phosphate synthase/phosphatase
LRLVVVANRGPIRKTENGWEAAIGGLATAVLPVLERQGGVWVSMQEETGLPERQPYPEAEERLVVRRVPLSEEEMERYYQGMSNSVLWPISHYMIQHLSFERGIMDAYADVNRRFAVAAIEEYRDGDLVWVHDYHLMLAPRHIRRSLPNARIGHFWHIPWPAMEVFRILPWARDLMRGMLSCDLVGFHVEEYVENFLKAARVLLGAGVSDSTIHWEGRHVRVEAHPIGIDVQSFEESAEEVVPEAEALRRECATEFLVIGIDRLDYTKGVLSRLLAYEQFLKRYPRYHRRVTFFQIATPTRTEVESYKQLKREVDEAVGRINGAFAQENWLPVRYRYRTYTQHDLCVLYRAADVALITPLRDGMNLVTQEFVAASRNGVLVLSELTGAAYLMPEALQVNPYDPHGLIQAIKDALEMPVDEKRERLARLKKTVARLDVHRWADGFLAAMAA